MHIADYTKLFATPDELADFLMLCAWSKIGFWWNLPRREESAERRCVVG
jgi:hypothetical protein